MTCANCFLVTPKQTISFPKKRSTRHKLLLLPLHALSPTLSVLSSPFPVYTDSNNLHSDLILNKTTFWLRCLHDLLVEYHIPVYMTPSMSDKAQMAHVMRAEFHRLPSQIWRAPTLHPHRTVLMSCWCHEIPLWLFSWLICCGGRQALLVDYGTF